MWLSLWQKHENSDKNNRQCGCCFSFLLASLSSSSTQMRNTGVIGDIIYWSFRGIFNDEILNLNIGSTFATFSCASSFGFSFGCSRDLLLTKRKKKKIKETTTSAQLVKFFIALFYWPKIYISKRSDWCTPSVKQSHFFLNRERHFHGERIKMEIAVILFEAFISLFRYSRMMTILLFHVHVRALFPMKLSNFIHLFI